MVPLLVVVPLLAASEAAAAVAGAGASAASSSLAKPLLLAFVKACAAIAAIQFGFRRALDRAFATAAKARSREAFLSVALLAAVGVSAFTESVGLSGTLGAFLAGLSLSETRYRYQVEADIAPFRGMLLGLFFVTVGFSIDVALVMAKPATVFGLAAGLVAVKASLLFALGLAFRLPTSAALRAGLLLAQGGEFAFVAFGLGTRLGLIDPKTSRLLLTSVALTMAATPTLSQLGASAAQELEGFRERTSQRLELQQRATDAVDTDAVSLSPGAGFDAEEFAASGLASAKNLVVVLGYGRLGKVVCEMLDAKLHRYVVVEKDEKRAADAREKGYPVYRGDAASLESLEAYAVKTARLVVVAFNDDKQTSRAVVNARRLSPTVAIVARAVDFFSSLGVPLKREFE